MTWTTPAAASGPGLLLAIDLPRSAACPTTPVAVLAPVGGLVPVAGGPAPIRATGLSGAADAVRLRGSAAAGTTGSYPTGVLSFEAIEQLNSTVPGEQPPRDPLGD